MRENNFPILLLLQAILIGVGGLIGITSQLLDFGFDYKILIAVFGWLVMTGLISLMFFAFYNRFKNTRRLIVECTESATGTIKESGLSAINTGNSNPAFITIEFDGFDKTFCYVNDELRFKYKQGDDIKVLYNPKNKQEFIF